MKQSFSIRSQNGRGMASTMSKIDKLYYAQLFLVEMACFGSSKYHTRQKITHNSARSTYLGDWGEGRVSPHQPKIYLSPHLEKSITQ